MRGQEDRKTEKKWNTGKRNEKQELKKSNKKSRGEKVGNAVEEQYSRAQPSQKVYVWKFLKMKKYW